MLAAAAVVAGAVVRFKGLGRWPFGVDEYYLSASVQNLLAFGVPVYECGGYYTRGVLVQYLAAGLQLLGSAPELATRLVAAVAGLAVLPAVFLIGRRVHGTHVGLLAVALVAISAWEVEMSRFGRMYTPFQAVFVWYVVFFLSYTIDRHRPALWGMIALSIVGVLVWEGGALLAVANLLPPFLNHARGRLSWSHWRYLGGMALLLIPLYWFATGSFRMVAEVPPLPPDFAAVTASAASADGAGERLLLLTLPQHAFWLVLALVPLAAAAAALPWIRRISRDRWLTAAGLLIALGAALAHQFLVFAAVLVLLLLTRLSGWRELLNRDALPFWAAAVLGGVFWLGFALATETWRSPASGSTFALLVSIGYQLLGFPDVLDTVARAWARPVPVLGLTLLLALATAAAWTALRPERAPAALRTVLVVVAVMVLLVGASDPPRIETRYTFFLYPLLIVVAVTMLVRGVEMLSKGSRSTPLWGGALVLVWFALTEDFRPEHLRRIDSYEINFKVGMAADERSHYYSRSDVRAVANWLSEHADPATDLVISGPGVASIDFYYPHLDWVYVDPADQRLGAWSCQRGTVERWTNLPLVYSVDTLQARIAASPRAYIVIADSWLEWAEAELAPLNPTVAWENSAGMQMILAFDRESASPAD